MNQSRVVKTQFHARTARSAGTTAKQTNVCNRPRRTNRQTLRSKREHHGDDDDDDDDSHRSHTRDGARPCTPRAGTTEAYLPGGAGFFSGRRLAESGAARGAAVLTGPGGDAGKQDGVNAKMLGNLRHVLTLSISSRRLKMNIRWDSRRL
jgi:hypothetical protein